MCVATLVTHYFIIESAPAVVLLVVAPHLRVALGAVLDAFKTSKLPVY